MGITVADKSMLPNTALPAMGSFGEIRAKLSPWGHRFPGGVNFSIYSRNATAVELLLFNREDDVQPERMITIDPATNRTYHYWHVFVPDVRPGQLYGYRVDGPFDPASGMRFDPSKVLLDPYGRGVVVPRNYSRDAARARRRQRFHGDEKRGGRSLWLRLGRRHASPPSRLPDHHLRNARGGFHAPSQFRSFGKNTRHLCRLDREDSLSSEARDHCRRVAAGVSVRCSMDAPPGRVNYWGYAPVSFFAPHQAYSSRRNPLGPVNEFRDMVKALHRAGIEVILDVVFNHTAEGNHLGPTISFRGLENSAYYILEADRSRYANYSGTGNTLNTNHPVVRRMILDSLRYWVEAMHVDGFRFDLASILDRDESGNLMPNPPVLWDIDSDPVLADTKLIAEAWDAAGLYQVGSFIGDSWREWNGRFRDDVRSFFRGDDGIVGNLADRLLGSPQIYGHKKREAEESVNFVTCHDGFTLNDLVSYNQKHNEANGEDNRDGTNDNRSWNCGVEGPTNDPAIERLRNRQVKNFLTVTLLALGLPMISMGDEVRRTQNGNNNAYCQDDETSWFDWTLVSKHADVHRFVTMINARRLFRDLEPERQSVTLNEILRESNKAWHGVRLGQPDWSDSSHSLTITAEGPNKEYSFHVILNAYWEALEFELPKPGDNGRNSWRRWIDTTLESPLDIVDWEKAPSVPGSTYRVGPRSVVVLFALIGNGASQSLLTRSSPM